MDPNNLGGEMFKIDICKFILGLIWLLPFTTYAARPPQYVVVSFDGSKSLPMWKETREVAKNVGGNFTYFLSGVYFINAEDKMLYNPPAHKQGRSDIGFARSVQDISDRITQVDLALSEGAEMASHVNGHFDGSTWSYKEWYSEFEQFHTFVKNVFINYPTIELPGIASKWGSELSENLKGFRAPLLAINTESSKVLSDFGYFYDASRVAASTKWPYKLGTTWQFPLATIPIAGTAKKTISMDYNFYYQDSKAKEDLTNSDFYQERYYQSLLNHFKSNYYGNRAPINIGNHFSAWNGGAYFKGLMRFATEVCGNKELYPEVQCLNYRSLVGVLNLTNEKQITEWEKGKFQKLEQKKKIIIGFQNVNLLGQELDKNYDLSLDFQLLNGRLINQFKGLDRNSLINNKLKKWKISFWPSIYSTNENKKLSLIQNKNEVTEIESTERNPNLQKILINQNNELNGTYILRLALNIGSIEIQAVSRKVLIKNKEVIAISSITEESIASKGDLLEAHLEDE